MANPEEYTCTCGFTWKHGHDGSHNCSTYYEATIKDLRAVIDKADKFVEDVLPQVGKLCIQDFQNLNEMCMGITQAKKRPRYEQN